MKGMARERMAGGRRRTRAMARTVFRRGGGLLVCAAVLVLGVRFYPQLLAGAARVLVVDEREMSGAGLGGDLPSPLVPRDPLGGRVKSEVSAIEGSPPLRFLVVLGGTARADHRHDVAAEFVQRNPAGRIVLIEAVPDALVEHGVLPPDHVLDLAALAERGISEEAIEVIGEPADGPWQAMRRLGRWLGDRPGAAAAVVCDRFHSRCLRGIADAVLEPDVARRVRIWALAHRDYNESNWWHRRTSARQFVYAWLHLVFHRVRGEPDVRRRFMIYDL